MLHAPTCLTPYEYIFIARYRRGIGGSSAGHGGPKCAVGALNAHSALLPEVNWLWCRGARLRAILVNIGASMTKIIVQNRLKSKVDDKTF